LEKVVVVEDDAVGAGALVSPKIRHVLEIRQELVSRPHSKCELVIVPEFGVAVFSGELFSSARPQEARSVTRFQAFHWSWELQWSEVCLGPRQGNVSE
jgi:hypothetical protein